MILGEGEPLLRPDILELLTEISHNSMIPVLFTCGDALGDESLCRQSLGLSPHEVVEQLFDIGSTVVLKFDSWQQDDMVGRAGYTEARDRALDLLIAAGLNQVYPSRLGFGIVLLKRNCAEVPSIFRFALESNIYPLVCPLMPIGRSSTREFRDTMAPTRSETRALRTQLVEIREEYGVKDGRLSDFPGGLPCDVSRCGMYVDDQGKLLICESDDCVGNIRTASLADLWACVDGAKDRKYGAARRRGLCFPKRMRGIV